MKTINLFTTEDTLLNILQFKKIVTDELSKNQEEVTMSIKDLMDYVNIGSHVYCLGDEIFPFKTIEINKQKYLIYMYDGKDKKFESTAIKTISNIKDFDDLKEIAGEEALGFDFQSPYFLINKKIYVQ